MENDAEDLWRTAVDTARAALNASGVAASEIAAIGITNQRETVVLWDRGTGAPVSRAIVWQDRRTAEHCARLRADGAEQGIGRRTGLLLDPYFSATKIAWMLQHVPGARAAAEAALPFRPSAGRPGRRARQNRLLAPSTLTAPMPVPTIRRMVTLLFTFEEECWPPV